MQLTIMLNAILTGGYIPSNRDTHRGYPNPDFAQVPHLACNFIDAVTILNTILQYSGFEDEPDSFINQIGK
jgi:hypothetical protein